MDEALQVAVQIADALPAAHHAGVVHWNLESSNIMLAKFGAKARFAREPYGVVERRP